MFTVQCARCREELTEPGAILFSPPSKSEQKCVQTFVCSRCYDIVREEMKSYVHRKRLNKQNPYALGELRKP